MIYRKYIVLTKGRAITSFADHAKAFDYCTELNAYPKGVFQVVRVAQKDDGLPVTVVAPLNCWAKSFDLLGDGLGIEAIKAAHPHFRYAVI